MILPNKLTVLRVVMIPIFVLFMLTDLAGDASKYIALALFCLASLTDFIDDIWQESTTWLQTSESLWTRLQTSFWCALQ